MSGAMEITVDEQQTHHITSTSTVKINNFKRFTETQQEVRSKDMEIFPGKKVALVVRILPEKAPDGHEFTRYRIDDWEDWTAISERDKFISLELVVGECFDPPRLAGKVEIILGGSRGGSSQSFTFGDLLTEEYLQISSRSLALKPGKVEDLYSACPDLYSYADLAANLVHVKLTDDGEEETLQIKFTLLTPNPERSKPSYLSAQTMKIMKDVSTSDLKISCGEKENKKIFPVHKNFFCASSPVFRAAIESDMLEGRTKEIYIEEVEEKTVQEMINYVYTGEFTGAEINVEMVAWLADKYDLPGMMDLLCSRMKDENAGPEIIADMLIAADKHDSAALKQIAVAKLKNNKEIRVDPAFRRKLDPDFLIDLYEEFIP